MSPTHFIRRLHLYLGLALLPWFFMYGVTSIPFTHNRYFEQRDAAKTLPLWTLRSEHSFDELVPDGAKAQRELGRRILAVTGVDTPSFGVYAPNASTLEVYAYSFRHATRIRYAVADRKLRVEDRRFRIDHFLTGVHARGGYQDGFLPDIWALIVDVVCIALLIWIATGYFMWWNSRGQRLPGGLAILAGAGSFAAFMFLL